MRTGTAAAAAPATASLAAYAAPSASAHAADRVAATEAAVTAVPAIETPALNVKTEGSGGVAAASAPQHVAGLMTASASAAMIAVKVGTGDTGVILVQQ